MRTEIRRREAALLKFAIDLHPVLQRVYSLRGLHEGDLDLSLDRLLPVSSLSNVDAAANLLAGHREHGRVLIVGDFDADGATSSALMVRALRLYILRTLIFWCPVAFASAMGSRLRSSRWRPLVNPRYS